MKLQRAFRHPIQFAIFGVSLCSSLAHAQSAPPTDAPAAPAPAGAPAPAPNAWDQVIQKSSQQEHALETDEERKRRAERLSRDSDSFLLAPRLGLRFDTGAHYQGLSDDSGEANFVSAFGAQLAVPFSRSFEFVSAAQFLAGGGTFFTFGPTLDANIRYVAGEHFYAGFGIHSGAIQVDRQQYYYYCPTSSFSNCDHYSKSQEFGLFLHGVASAGIFLDPRRNVELGLDIRVGADSHKGQFTFLPTLHVAYMWALY